MAQLGDASAARPLDWEDVSFTTCSYIERRRSRRARLVSRAEQTWAPLLALPFGERVFVDDGSPSALALAQLSSAGIHRLFDSLRYNGREHPLHPNFGIVESPSAAGGTFIVHIDDDVEVNASSLGLESYLGECLAVLTSDAAGQEERRLPRNRTCVGSPPTKYRRPPYPPVVAVRVLRCAPGGKRGAPHLQVTNPDCRFTGKAGTPFLPVGGPA